MLCSAGWILVFFVFVFWRDGTVHINDNLLLWCPAKVKIYINLKYIETCWEGLFFILATQSYQNLWNRAFSKGKKGQVYGWAEKLTYKSFASLWYQNLHLLDNFSHTICSWSGHILAVDTDDAVSLLKSCWNCRWSGINTAYCNGTASKECESISRTATLDGQLKIVTNVPIKDRKIVLDSV